MIRRPLADSPHLSALTLLLAAAALPLDLPAQAIAHNSFLVEEAYNQEAGVVQHTSTWSRPHGGGAWDYSFTQEWPLGGVSHQVSYTIPIVDPSGAQAAGVQVNLPLSWEVSPAGRDALFLYLSLEHPFRR